LPDITRGAEIMSLEDQRAEINNLDAELLRLLNRRARIAMKVGAAKQASGLSLCDHTREREVIDRMCQANEGPLDDRAIVELFRAIIHESRRIQNRNQLGSNEAHQLLDKISLAQAAIAIRGRLPQLL